MLSNLLSASSLQMQNYMLLWDYQDAGFTHYCLLTEGENCDDCNNLEGQIFPISEALVGENFAPMHPNCNCRVGILDEENRVVAIIGEEEEQVTRPEDKNTQNWLDSISDLLTAASLIPGLDTFTNLASIPVDLARGDFASAGLSALGVIPIVGEAGDAAKLAKMADKAIDATKNADKVSDTAKGVKVISPLKLSLNANTSLKPQELLDELAKSNVKHNPEKVIAVVKTVDDKLLWLEQGNHTSGLVHIWERHANDFAVQDVTDIPQLLFDILKTSPVKTGSNAKGFFADYIFNENTYRVAYGTNGYIVTFYPID